MIHKINSIFLNILRYRLHVSFLYFIILQKFWMKYVDEEIDWPVVISFALWHFGIYLIDRVYDCEKDNYSQKEEAIPEKQKNALMALSFFILFIPILILWLSGKSVVIYLAIVPFAFLYTFPIFGFKKRLKDLFLVKNLYSATIIWPLSIFICLYGYSSLEFNELIQFDRFYQLAIITFIIEVFWDIRDVEGDLKFGVKTIPNSIGINLTKVILLTLLVLCFMFLNTSLVTFLSLIVTIVLAKKTANNVIYHIPLLLNVIEFYIR